MRKFLALSACLAFLVVPLFVHAQETEQGTASVRATVTEIERDWTEDGRRQIIFSARDDEGTPYRVDTSQGYLDSGVRYDVRPGTRVILQVVNTQDGSTDVYLADVVRVNGLFWAFLIFCLVSLLVGLWRGLLGLLCLTATVAVLFGFILPQILAGASPVPVTVLGSIAILAINMHVSHGFNRRAFSAFLSTVVGLLLAVAASVFFVKLGALSGLATEEANYLFLQLGGAAYPEGLLLAGIILGAVGVLDDIAITQSETVGEIALADPRLGVRELFSRSMRVGRHHIASTINTLVLAYVGAALPLFLLFMSLPDLHVFDFLNIEAVAEEIVRTLAGTIALVLTVPLSSLFAAWVCVRYPKSEAHPHHH